jgi:positive regulator of sigma E activity
MAVIGGILGALFGFAIGVFFTEIVFANNHEWPIIVPFGLAVFGWLVGSTLARRFANRKADGLS